MAAFTVQLEVGPETRKLIERVAGTVVVQFELGPKTREIVEDLVRQRETDAPPARQRPR